MERFNIWFGSLFGRKVHGPFFERIPALSPQVQKEKKFKKELAATIKTHKLPPTQYISDWALGVSDWALAYCLFVERIKCRDHNRLL
jgi:hypothetical protein